MAPDRELIEAYQQGQVSRRTFIRRLVGSGISLAAALTYADALWGEPAFAGDPSSPFYSYPEPNPADVEILVTSAFSPTPLRVAHGTSVRWRFAQQHSVTNTLGFLNSGIKPWYDPNVYPPEYTMNSDTYTRRFPASGRFEYFCEHPTTTHPQMTGMVEVPMFRQPNKGDVGDRFDIFWSLVPAPPGYLFDVEIKRPDEKGGGGGGGGQVMAPGGGGGGGWDDWKKGTTKPGAKFKAKDPGRYRFRARLRSTSGAKSGWSPPTSIRAN